MVIVTACPTATGCGDAELDLQIAFARRRTMVEIRMARSADAVFPPWRPSPHTPLCYASVERQIEV
jgi:hypothetical protein